MLVTYFEVFFNILRVKADVSQEQTKQRLQFRILRTWSANHLQYSVSHVAEL